MEFEKQTSQDLERVELRKSLIERFPGIRSFTQARDPSFVFVVLLNVITQISISYWLSTQPTTLLILFTVLVGPMYNYASFAMFHETIHDAALPMHWPRQIYCTFILIANLPLAFSFSGSFYQVHRNHHSKLGSDHDVKYLPLSLMTKFDKNIFTRLLYLTLYPIIFYLSLHMEYYALDRHTTKFLNLANNIVQPIFLYLLYYFGGWSSMIYILGGVYLNYSIMFQGIQNHSDHAVGWDGQAHTYSSYGWWNLLSANLGLHREHHDFPSCPGRYLPSVHMLASQFYLEDDKEHCNDYFYSNFIPILKAEQYKGLTRLSPKEKIPNNNINCPKGG